MRKIQWRSSHITIAGMTYAKEVHLLPSYNSRSRTFDVLSSPMTSIEITQYLKLHTQIIAAQNIIRKLNQHHVPQHLKRRRNFWHQDTMFKYGTDRTFYFPRPTSRYRPMNSQYLVDETRQQRHKGFPNRWPHQRQLLELHEKQTGQVLRWRWRCPWQYAVTT